MRTVSQSNCPRSFIGELSRLGGIQFTSDKKGGVEEVQCLLVYPSHGWGRGARYDTEVSIL
jgi:hypothetical protein